MRTTLSLDEEIAALLNKEMRRSGSSFKETVNHFLRLGLMSFNAQKLKPFKVKPFPVGLPSNLNYENVAELLDELEGPTRR